MEKLNLNSLGIHSLRKLARDFGILAPTSKKKAELIRLINEKQKNCISFDKNQTNASVCKKGRPVLKDKIYKIDENSNELFEELLEFIKKLKEQIEFVEVRIKNMINIEKRP